jgi:hypothetical protein
MRKANVFDVEEDDEEAINAFRNKKKGKTIRSAKIAFSDDSDPKQSIVATISQPNQIAYIYSKKSAELSSLLPTNFGRVISHPNISHSPVPSRPHSNRILSSL